jgi:DNA-binding YbaB/EbfC family protein
MEGSGGSGGSGGPFGGGPGPFGGIGDLLKQAANIKQRLSDMQAELQNRRVEGTAGGGMVTATVNGKGELLALRIEREVVNPDEIDMLQDLICAAVTQAVRNSRDALQEEMSKLTGGIKIPGLF